MDSNVLAPLIPVVAILSYTVVKVAKIMAAGRTNLPDPDTGPRLAALEEEMSRVNRQLEEAHERLEFTERLLARQPSDRLNPPS